MKNIQPLLISIEESIERLLFLEGLEMTELLRTGITMGMCCEPDIDYLSCERLKNCRYFIDKFYFDQLFEIARTRDEYPNITAGKLVKESYLKLI